MQRTWRSSLHIKHTIQLFDGCREAMTPTGAVRQPTVWLVVALFVAGARSVALQLKLSKLA